MKQHTETTSSPSASSTSSSSSSSPSSSSSSSSPTSASSSSSSTPPAARSKILLAVEAARQTIDARRQKEAATRAAAAAKKQARRELELQKARDRRLQAKQEKQRQQEAAAAAAAAAARLPTVEPASAVALFDPQQAAQVAAASDEMKRAMTIRALEERIQGLPLDLSAPPPSALDALVLLRARHDPELEALIQQVASNSASETGGLNSQLERLNQRKLQLWATAPATERNNIEAMQAQARQEWELNRGRLEQQRESFLHQLFMMDARHPLVKGIALARRTDATDAVSASSRSSTSFSPSSSSSSLLTSTSDVSAPLQRMPRTLSSHLQQQAQRHANLNNAWAAPSGAYHVPGSFSSSPTFLSGISQLKPPVADHSRSLIILPASRMELFVSTLQLPVNFTQEFLQTLSKCTELFLQYLGLATAIVALEQGSNLSRVCDLRSLIMSEPPLMFLRWALENDELLADDSTSGVAGAKLKRAREEDDAEDGVERERRRRI